MHPVFPDQALADRPKPAVFILQQHNSTLDKSAKFEYNIPVERRELRMYDTDYDPETGKPLDKSYLEENLPPFLTESLENMKEAWVKKETGHYLNWDCDYCDLQSSINMAEVENLITSEQAWYLREKYLYMRKPGDIDD